MKILFDLNRDQLKSLAEYRDVLETGKFFKKNFWQKEKALPGIKPNCQVITRYCLETIEGLMPEDLPSLNLKQIKEILVKNRLFGMVQCVFNNDILAVLKNPYPNEFKKRRLAEWMWSKHGTWQNDNYVIEAVQYMVLKEGIRKVELIPGYDWKKRLLKCNIYNILSRFNWSVFNMFDFVYPGRFHPADFKYKTKWKTSSEKDALRNARRLMDRVFKESRYTREQILLINTTGFRKLGLTSMLRTVFDGSPEKAKEFYLYRTQYNKANLLKLKEEIKTARINQQNQVILEKLKKVAKGKYIYNLHSDQGVYSYIKRKAAERNLTVSELIEQFGFCYKNAREESTRLDPMQIWNLRKKRLTYVQIAEILGSNPTTISLMCKRHVGGDPLIPRPVENYITIQELMDSFHVDHKTIMKLVREKNLENHMTIRNRYLKRSEIVPAILEYKNNSFQHQALLNRYAGS
ncbi:MAG: hypothetical protein GX045_00230 [Clostridiaceae bacterium]|nr:hypothetical protein [Clostridiaceae bacterium]